MFHIPMTAIPLYTIVFHFTVQLQTPRSGGVSDWYSRFAVGYPKVRACCLPETTVPTNVFMFGESYGGVRDLAILDD